MKATPQVLAVLLGLAAAITGRSSLAIALSVDATQSIIQELPNYNCLPAELALSVVVNQMALVRLLNDSSTTCSLLESDKKNLEDMKHQLNATGQVLEELQEAREAAMNEFNEKHEQAKKEISDLKDAVKVEMQTWSEETKQNLQESLANLKEVPMTGQLYLLHNDSKTHSEAMAACEKLGGRLAVPRNAEQNAALQSLVNRQSFSPGRYWIGVDDKEEEGKWTDSVTGHALTYTIFASDQPDNFGGHEDCVEMGRNWDGWNDSACTWKGPGYLCEFAAAYITA